MGDFRFENGRDRKYLGYKLIRHYNLSAGYKFVPIKDFRVEPLILVRSAQGLPSQIDFNTTVYYKDKIWTNLVFRPQSGMGMAIGFMVEEKLSLGYHYEYPITGIKNLTNGSHEFSISYRFGKHKDAPIKIEGLDKLHKENEEQYEMIDQLEKKTDTLKKRVDQHDIEINKLKEIYKREQQESEEFRKRESILPSDIEKIKRESKRDEGLRKEEYSKMEEALQKEGEMIKSKEEGLAKEEEVLKKKLDLLRKREEGLKRKEEGLKNREEGLKKEERLRKEKELGKESELKKSGNASDNNGSIIGQIDVENEETNRKQKIDELDIKPLENKSLTHLDFYLVVGSFSNVQDAKLLQTVLKREYDMDSWIALSRAIQGRSRFLIYIKVVRPSDDSKKELKDAKEMDTKRLFPNEPWLYRVK